MQLGTRFNCICIIAGKMRWVKFTNPSAFHTQQCCGVRALMAYDVCGVDCELHSHATGFAEEEGGGERSHLGA